jgi:hypothetical protein
MKTCLTPVLINRFFKQYQCPKKLFTPIRLIKPLAPCAKPFPCVVLAGHGQERLSLEPSLVHLEELHQIGFNVQGFDNDNFALNFTFF